MSKPIIKRIKKLKGVGIFESYQHGKDDKTPEFQRYNLIYGFNGSGKTTLSRLFHYLDGDGSSPPDANLGEFVFGLDNGKDAGSKKGTEDLAGRVLVFNTDFVRDNLSWTDSHAEAVFYVGRDSTRRRTLLNRVERHLGKREESRREAASNEKSAKTNLSNFHTNTARIIREMLNETSYNASSLNRDYQSEKWKAFEVLSDDKRNQLIELIRLSQPLAQLSEPECGLSNVKNVLEEAKLLCETTLSGLTLQEMQNHPSMIPWLKAGYKYHKENSLIDCLFCGSGITEQRFADLQNGLDERIDQFFEQIENIETKLKKEKETVDNAISNLPGISDISIRFSESYGICMEQFKQTIDKIQKIIEKVQSAIVSKREQANTSNWPACLNENMINETFDHLETIFKEIKHCIANHNKEQREFQDEQKDARNKLAFSVLQEYNSERERLEKLQAEAKKILEVRTNLHSKSTELSEALNQQIREHGPAAEEINRLLWNYLGHKEIRLEALDIGFRILYREKPMDNMISEGERTAVALCYFLSKLGDKSEDAERKISEQIVVIDDPISSLDSGSLNYAFILLREKLKNARQLFILTHNLNFMNETKKWLRAKNSKKSKDQAEKKQAEFFFVRTFQKEENDLKLRKAALEKMSQLLTRHDSEYHYFFFLVKKGLAQSMTHQNVPGHVMPHIIRRVLETFLTFKVPTSSLDSLSSKLRKLCKDYPEIEEKQILALERLAQSQSHSDNMDDFVGYPPMTVEETERAANALMKLMEKVDHRHHKLMCKQSKLG